MIHSDYLRYKTRSKTKIAEDIDDEKRAGDVDNALVAFIAVEKEDEENPEIIVQKATKEILNVQNKVNADNIVIYPYAHLSSSLSNADVAKKILKEIEESLTENNEEVMRVPFGWYKSFELACKGHPLSELSRTITTEPEDEDEQPEEETESEPNELLVLDVDGTEYDIKEYNYKAKTLKQLIDHETGKAKDTKGSMGGQDQSRPFRLSGSFDNKGQIRLSSTDSGVFHRQDEGNPENRCSLCDNRSRAYRGKEGRN